MDYDEAVSRRTDGSLVWHYTSLETLALILGSNTLLATEASFLNDINEATTADEAFQAVLSRLLDQEEYADFATATIALARDFDDGTVFAGNHERQLRYGARFVLCGSMDSDSLYAWRTYVGAGQIGCAIGLDRNVPLGVIDVGSSSPHVEGYAWTKVVYSPEALEKVAHRELVALGNQWNLEVANTGEYGYSSALGVLLTRLDAIRSSLRSRAKNPSFADELEQRVTFHEPASASGISFTASPMGPRPHLRVTRTEDWGSVVATTDGPRLPIRAIRLGPSAPSSAESSLKWMLYANRYPIDPLPQPEGGDDWLDTVAVLHSRHPFRSV